MNEPKPNSDLLTELRALKQRLELEERKSISLKASLDLKEDQLRQATHERDYYRDLASDLASRARAVMALTRDMVNEAAETAREMVAPDRPSDVVEHIAKAVGAPVDTLHGSPSLLPKNGIGEEHQPVDLDELANSVANAKDHAYERQGLAR